MKIHQKAGPNPHSKRDELAELLQRLIDHCCNPARLIELYYWSVEPELAAVMRQYTSLPANPRTALRAFLSMTKDCSESISVTVGQDGQITLSSPIVSELMYTMTQNPISKGHSECTH
jgi:hypothetical protein